MLDVAKLEVQELLWRATKSRQSLLDALERLDEDTFHRLSPGEWSPAQLLRHVVWVECYWVAAARALKEAPGQVLDVTQPDTLQSVLADASRLAGMPLQPEEEPPAFSTREEALRDLEGSRHAFSSVVASLEPKDFHHGLSGPRGTVSLRFCLEHIIEHDWDHAIQLADSR